ncbi:AtpZ/AtpI family protein [Desulfobulbus elongatus]|uniref:AtpZ/AtpI family protein n=1 Tax=Desulfobulbus elongatus TaxID=53332 RepID=UPI0004878B2C|nr:AtpZ/AtpI family protein [Desulfobulbus elongatus]
MADDRREMFRQLAVYSQAGMTFVFSILIGFGMGWALDNKVFAGKTAPYLTFIFLGCGIAAGFKGLWDLTRKMNDG